MIEKKFVELLKSGDVTNAIHFICDHYTEFSKEQMKMIIKELLFGARDDPQVMECAGEELECDWYYYFED